MGLPRIILYLITAAKKKDWSVYVLRCADGTLYTGIAKDARARLSLHNDGKGAKYTRSRRPARLLYVKEGMSRSQALSREARIKSLTRREKEALIARRASCAPRAASPDSR